MAPTPLPTVAPAAATLFPAAVPPVPQGWTQAQTTDWITHHEFIHLLDAVHEHVGALPNRQTNHVRELSRLYWNEHVAGTVLSGLKNNRWANTGSLFSHKSRSKLAIANLHLASKHLPPARRVNEALDTWNTYLDSLNLPRVREVGDGLNGLANPGQSVGPAVAAAASAAGDSGAPAPFAVMAGVAVGRLAGIGPSNPPAIGMTAAASVYRMNDNDRAAVDFLVTLAGSTAGPSIAAAPVGLDEEEDDDDDTNGNANANDVNDDQPPTKRRRVDDGEDSEDGRRGAIIRKRKQRATDW